ncbi:MAG: hypothetical protein HWD59_13740 [Coxiellaceae bacterium]|nr:MAG: hypothetical protein HWD59_13740 [Coxiellaceae bacterium]
MLAVAAYDRGDYPTASQIWQRMLKQFPPESNEAKALQIMLATVQQKE